MKKFVQVLLILYLILGGVQAKAQQVQVVSPEKKEYLNRIASLIEHLQDLSYSKPLTKLKRVNRSYEDLKKAVFAFRGDGSPEKVKGFLEESLKNYSNNYVSALILGAYYDHEGNLEKAAKYYGDFISQSHFPLEFESKFISQEEISFFRNYLLTWHQLNDLPEPEIHVPLSYKFKKGLNRISIIQKESLLGAILTVVTFGGLGFLFFYAAIHTYKWPLFHHPAAIILFRSYLVTALAYFVWTCHLYFGIDPFIGNSLIYETYFILGIGITFVIILEVINWIQKRREIENNPNLQLCPHCKKPVLRLAVECIHCGKRI